MVRARVRVRVGVGVLEIRVRLELAEPADDVAVAVPRGPHHRGPVLLVALIQRGGLTLDERADNAFVALARRQVQHDPFVLASGGVDAVIQELLHDILVAVPGCPVDGGDLHPGVDAAVGVGPELDAFVDRLGVTFLAGPEELGLRGTFLGDAEESAETCPFSFRLRGGLVGPGRAEPCWGLSRFRA